MKCIYTCNDLQRCVCKHTYSMLTYALCRFRYLNLSRLHGKVSYVYSWTSTSNARRLNFRLHLSCVSFWTFCVAVYQ